MSDASSAEKGQNQLKVKQHIFSGIVELEKMQVTQNIAGLPTSNRSAFGLTALNKLLQGKANPSCSIMSTADIDS
jgi:hypothetical protein